MKNSKIQARKGDLEELKQAREWLDVGLKVVLATVVQTWGSSPRPVGSHLVINQDGEIVGSVSGGCIEGAVVQEALELLESGKSRLVEFGVSTEQAWEVGLSCGGGIHIHLEQLQIDSPVMTVADLLAGGEKAATITAQGEGLRGYYCHTFHFSEIDSAEGCFAQSALDAVVAMLASGSSGYVNTEKETFFVRSYQPGSQIILIGAVHISQYLAPMAALAGFSVTVIDPRPAFATEQRFSDVTLIQEWPDEALASLSLDASTAIVTLTHDPKFDDPAIIRALDSQVFYIGSLGSKRTHSQRLERLSEIGLQDKAQRIFAPVGLDLGGRAPAEIAVAILAEIIQTRYGKVAA
ncbi:MAG: XdhC family protein [Amphritea sp.]